MTVSIASSQNSDPSTVDRAELVTLCERAKDEVVTSRQLIGAYQEREAALTDALDKAERVSTLSAQEIDLLKAERTKIREALAKERSALATKELEVTEYKKALAKVTKKKNFFKTLTKALLTTTVISAAVAAAVILKE